MSVPRINVPGSLLSTGIPPSKPMAWVDFHLASRRLADDHGFKIKAGWLNERVVFDLTAPSADAEAILCVAIQLAVVADLDRGLLVPCWLDNNYQNER